MEHPGNRNTDDEMNEAEIDEAMLSLAEFVSQMTDVDGSIMDADNPTAMHVKQVQLSIPIQLDLLVKDDGSVILGGSPPLYYTETTILPVFHQLDVTIKLEKDDARIREQRVES